VSIPDTYFNPITREVTKKPNLSRLLADAGSLRILLNCYWRGRLQLAEERLIENEIQPEILIGYKPSDYR
jgi:hypothetical protein